MSNHKFELTWVGKEDQPKLVLRVNGKALSREASSDGERLLCRK